ncbi:MAG: hypothetical protein Q4F17_02810 [Eubacteriales bacterium]|nr:hypothetical protein [Eubacteriales bacterium]
MKKMFFLKKSSVVLAALVLVLSLGTVAYAASAAAPASPMQQPASDSSTEGLALSYTDPTDGSVAFSTDGGNNWLSKAELNQTSPAVEWWTYDGFKAWMETELENLNAIAGDGVPDYYDEDGTLKDYSKEDVEEIAATYQATLDEIKNGVQISKSVDGTEEIAMASFDTTSAQTGSSRDDNGSSEVTMSSHEDSAAEMGSTYGVVFTSKNGMVEVGPFDTKAELLEALEGYCKELIADGEMTEAAVEQLLAQYK